MTNRNRVKHPMDRNAGARERENVRTHMTHTILAIVLTAMFAGSAGAQQPQAADVRSVIVSAASAGWRVEAHLSDSTIYRGNIRSVTDSTFVVGGSAPISNASVSALYRVHRNNTGMLVLGGVGAAVGLFFLGMSSPDSPCPSCGLGLYALAGLGAMLGAFVSGDHMEILWRHS